LAELDMIIVKERSIEIVESTSILLLSAFFFPLVSGVI